MCVTKEDQVFAFGVDRATGGDMRDALDANITKIELFILSYDTKWRRKQVKLDHTHICAYIYDVYYIYNDICIKYSMVLQEKKIQKDVTIWNSLVPKTKKKNKQEKQKKNLLCVTTN